MPHTTPTRTPNDLIHETSPYLLQHAYNPVRWFPWGPAAFDAARASGKPIFLSIGYSTCYWCHVMERESFENQATAALLNESFICIKVDREEHPDVDDLYMTAATLLTGSGGWPLNLFLTPPPAHSDSHTGLQPFYAGTYFPPDRRFGRPAFADVLRAVADAWNSRRADVLRQADEVAAAVRAQLASESSAPAPLSATQPASALAALLRIADRSHGGFGSAPKFPQPVFLDFLLDIRDSVDDHAGHRADLDSILRLTLDRMALGGIRDHLAGGFHRYSTDAHWLIPHFEKMLYDNALLADVYARAARQYSDPFYASVALDTCDYVLREMTDPASGAFYSAQDAEVDHREGLNYLWLPAEIESVLASASRADLLPFATHIFNLDAGPNFQDPHHPSEPRRCVLSLPARPERLAAETNRSADDFTRDFADLRRILLAHRAQRKQPHLDDKVLCAWDGLMIAALARTGALLDRPELVAAAARAFSFIDTRMRAPDGTLLRTFRADQARIPAGFEDYAALIHGLLALAAASPDPARASFLASARGLAELARHLFRDESTGCWFDSRADRTDLFFRPRSLHDGAIPCASSMHLMNLISFAECAPEPAWRRAFLDDALSLLSSLSARLAENPVSAINSTRALFHLLRLAPDRLAAPPISPAPAPPSPHDGPFALSCSTETLDLSSATSQSFEITLALPPGAHIAAPPSALSPPPPDSPDVSPLCVNLDPPDADILTLILDFPPAQTLTLGDANLAVYHGSVTFRATLLRKSAAPSPASAPRLLLTAQVCTDSACLPPVTRPLPVRVVL